jgi:hypothetical protein
MFEGLPERALSIRQPWAWAILHAGKRLENRPVRWKYRGPICLHASLYNPKKTDIDVFVDTWHLSKPLGEDRLRQMFGGGPLEHLKGGIIGTADIVDCIDSSDDPWFFGPHALVLENVKPIDFIPVRGALGLFNWRNNL